MLILSLILGVVLSFGVGTFFVAQKMVWAAMVCWLGGAFYAGYMLCLWISPGGV